MLRPDLNAIACRGRRQEAQRDRSRCSGSPGTGGSQTHPWWEMDSNFQYAGAVNLVVSPFGWVVLCDRVPDEALLVQRGISDGAGRS